MHIILNIGLAPSTVLKGNPLDLSTVTTLLGLAGFTGISGTVKQSGTELTAVITATTPSWCRDFHHIQSAIYSVAMVLRQEAIAWCEDRPVRCDRCGWLTGPHALLWGAFDYSHFIFP